MSTLNQIYELLQCPVCYDTICDEVKTCHNGHVVCIECSDNLTQCPICRSDTLTLDKVLSILTVNLPKKCKYECGFLADYAKVLKHEKFCELATEPCPFTFNPCSWTGKENYFDQHILHDHSEISFESLKFSLEEESGSNVYYLGIEINIFHVAVSYDEVKATFNFSPLYLEDDSDFVYMIKAGTDEKFKIQVSQVPKNIEIDLEEPRLMFNTSTLCITVIIRPLSARHLSDDFQVFINSERED